VPVQLLSGNQVVARTLTDVDGRFSFDVAQGSQHQVRLAASAFRAPHPGIAWLGPTFITISIMIGYIWMQTGFAVVIIGAGLSSLDRELQEAARTDGATEFQVFRHVTVPVLMPILMVVLVTTVINVLKIFDLVYIIAPESMQPYANVLALEMWRASFGGARDFGLGSALAMLLLVMIIPAMLFNIRNFRRGG
jgi:alpha-glucoside transport system permease protein